MPLIRHSENAVSIVQRLMVRILEDFTIKTARQGDDSDSEIIYDIWKVNST